MYTYRIFSLKKVSKVFCFQEIDLKTGPSHWKVKISRRPNIGIWVVYPEAMACNVGGLYSDFYLGERILRWNPDCLFWKWTFRTGRWGLYLKIRSPKLKSEYNPPTLQAIAWGNLPVDRHPTSLCLVDGKFSLFNGWILFWGQFPSRYLTFLLPTFLTRPIGQAKKYLDQAVQYSQEITRTWMNILGYLY